MMQLEMAYDKKTNDNQIPGRTRCLTPTSDSPSPLTQFRSSFKAVRSNTLPRSHPSEKQRRNQVRPPSSPQSPHSPRSLVSMPFRVSSLHKGLARLSLRKRHVSGPNASPNVISPTLNSPFHSSPSSRDTSPFGHSFLARNLKSMTSLTNRKGLSLDHFTLSFIIIWLTA